MLQFYSVNSNTTSNIILLLVQMYMVCIKKWLKNGIDIIFVCLFVYWKKDKYALIFKY